MGFVQFMDYVPPLDAEDDPLGCRFLLWAPAEGGVNETDVDNVEEENIFTAARGWFGLFFWRVF